MGAAVVVAAMGTGAAAFQMDPEIVTRVSTTANGLWIPAPLSGEIVHIDGGSGEITARVEVSDPGAELELAERGNHVVLVDRTAGRVSLVDPALHEVTRQLDTLAAGPDLVDIGSNSIVLADGTQGAVLDIGVTAATSIEVGLEVGSIAALGTGAVVAGGEVVRSLGTTGIDPVDLETDLGVRVVRAGGSVMVIDGTTLEEYGGSRSSCLSEALGPDARVTGHDSGVVISADGGLVQMSDIETGECRRVRIGAADTVLGRPAMADGFVFVPEPAASSVHVIDPTRGRSTVHRVAFGATDLRIRSRGDVVVAYASDSSFAALMDADGVVKIVNTFRVDQPLQAVLGDVGSSAVVGGDTDAPGIGLDGVEGTGQATNALEIEAAVLAATIRNADEEAAPTPTPDLPSDELVANFAFSADTVAVGTEVRFVDESTGSPRSWIWDFGDGEGAEGPEATHAWQQPGTYTVTLHVSRDDDSAQISLAFLVIPAEVELPPSADFTVSAAVVSVGDAVFFEDRSAGDIVRRRWDFGDGTGSAAANPSKAWSSSGRYTVVLTVSNEQGADSATIVVEVVDELRPPVVVVGASSELVEVGEPVVFSAVSTTDPALFSWEFGDGDTSSGDSVTHVFTVEGTHTVAVLAANDAGTSTAQIQVTVVPATVVPLAHIGALPAIIEVGDVVTLNSLSTNGPDTEEWSFGDGQTAIGTTVTHTWTTPGMFLVSLTATNGAGTSTATQLIEVVAELSAPVAVVATFDKNPWVGESTLFTDGSLDATTWLWDFGDGVNSTTRNPLHTFSSVGPNTVTLTVSNRNGSHTTSVVVEPRLRPTAAFTASSAAPRAGESVEFLDLSVNAATWSWDFGDGFASNLQNPSHTYAAQGLWSVRLTVTTAAGDLDTSLPLQIAVDPAPPTLSGIEVNSPATTLSPHVLSAIVGASSGPIDTYEINYGDGSTIEGGPLATFQHSFLAAGTYTIQMRARGPLADWTPWISRTLTVTDPAPVINSISPFVGTTGVAVSFVPSVTGSVSSWAWDFGDSGSSSLQSPSHVFAAAGSYTVGLTVTAADGQFDVLSVSVTVTDPAP